MELSFIFECNSTSLICGMWLTAIKAVGLWLNLMTGDAHECHQDIEYYFVEKKIKMSVFKREIDLHFSQFEEI